MLVAGCSPTVVGCTPWLLDAVGAHHRATSWGRLRAGPLPLHTPKAETEASPHPYLNLFTWLYERLAPLIIMRCRIPWVQRQGRRATEIDTGQAVRLVTVACSLLIGRKLTGFLSVINRERKKNNFLIYIPRCCCWCGLVGCRVGGVMTFFVTSTYLASALSFLLHMQTPATVLCQSVLPA